MSSLSSQDLHYIPFYIRGLVFYTQGILRLEQQSLCVEFQQQCRLSPAIRSGISSVHIPLISFHRAEIKNGLGGAQLILSSNSLQPFRHLPRARFGQVAFQLLPSQHTQSEAFVSCLQLRLSEHHLNLNAFEAPELKNIHAQDRAKWRTDMKALSSLWAHRKNSEI